MATLGNPGPDTARGKSANLDPITKKPGAHPIGTGVGAAAGGIAGAAAAGAATGTVVGGPVGAAVGLVAGPVVGGLAGKAVAEKIDPTVEDAYWREAHKNQPYFDRAGSYDDYEPAYRVGYTGRAEHPERSFEDSESELEAAYNRERGKSRLGWSKAKEASRAAWNRVRSVGSTSTR